MIVDKMTVDKMTVDKMTVDKMTRWNGLPGTNFSRLFGSFISYEEY
jgi:hypothetical protein